MTRNPTDDDFCATDVKAASTPPAETTEEPAAQSDYNPTTGKIRGGEVSSTAVRRSSFRPWHSGRGRW